MPHYTTLPSSSFTSACSFPFPDGFELRLLGFEIGFSSGCCLDAVEQVREENGGEIWKSELMKAIGVGAIHSAVLCDCFR